MRRPCQCRGDRRTQRIGTSLALQCAVVVAVAIEKQCRQVKHVELARQCLGMAGIHFEEREVVMMCAVVGEQPLPGAATRAAFAGEDHERHTGRVCQPVMKSELVERNEIAGADRH